MIGVTLPECVLFACQLLNRRRQIFKAFPEAPIRLAGHGSSSSLPARMFSRTSSRTGRSRPSSAKSASICWSQVAFSRSRTNEASSVNSRGESVSTASLISAKLTLEACQSRMQFQVRDRTGREPNILKQAARLPLQLNIRVYSCPFVVSAKTKTCAGILQTGRFKLN